MWETKGKLHIRGPLSGPKKKFNRERFWEMLSVSLTEHDVVISSMKARTALRPMKTKWKVWKKSSDVLKTTTVSRDVVTVMLSVKGTDRTQLVFRLRQFVPQENMDVYHVDTTAFGDHTIFDEYFSFVSQVSTRSCRKKLHYAMMAHLQDRIRAVLALMMQLDVLECDGEA